MLQTTKHIKEAFKTVGIKSREIRIRVETNKYGEYVNWTANLITGRSRGQQLASKSEAEWAPVMKWFDVTVYVMDGEKHLVFTYAYNGKYTVKEI